jgi:hypothetical protein
MTSSQPVLTPQALIFTPDNKHCFAYSGEIPSTTSAQTALEFSTNSEYIIFEAFFTGPIKFSDANTGRESNWQISLNDQVIALIRTDTSEADIKTQGYLKFIVPPFAILKIEIDSNDNAAYENCVLLTGQTFGMTNTGFQ